MTILTVDLVQPATWNKHDTMQAAADGIALSAHSPLTAEGMAAYAGVMTTFTGTSGKDVADASTGTLTGFTDGTVAELQDATGDTFNAGSGNDWIIAGDGADSIDGGDGNDRIAFDGSDVSIAGGTGADTLIVTEDATIDLVPRRTSPPATPRLSPASRMWMRHCRVLPLA